MKFGGSQANKPGTGFPNCPKCKAKPVKMEWVPDLAFDGFKRDEEIRAREGRTCIKCKMKVDDGYVPSKHICLASPPLAYFADYKYGINAILKAFADKKDVKGYGRCERVCRMCADLHYQADKIMSAVMKSGKTDEQREKFYFDNLVTLQRKFTPGGDCVSKEYVKEHVSDPNKGERYFMVGWELLQDALKRSELRGGKKKQQFVLDIFAHDKGYPHVLNSLLDYNYEFYDKFIKSGESQWKQRIYKK